MPFLGIPLWVWITGGAVGGAAVVVDQTGDTLESAAVALDSTTRLAKVALVGGVLYASYRVAQSAGVLK